MPPSTFIATIQIWLWFNMHIITRCCVIIDLPQCTSHCSCTLDLSLSLTFIWTIFYQVISSMSNNLHLIAIVPIMMPMALDFLSNFCKTFLFNCPCWVCGSNDQGCVVCPWNQNVTIFFSHHVQLNPFS